jgi:hypothetical protein
VFEIALLSAAIPDLNGRSNISEENVGTQRNYVYVERHYGTTVDLQERFCKREFRVSRWEV